MIAYRVALFARWNLFHAEQQNDLLQSVVRYRRLWDRK